MSNISVAIDGPAGAGKSTIAKIKVESAYISGFIPFFTSVYILVDRVSIPGPFVK